MGILPYSVGRSTAVVSARRGYLRSWAECGASKRSWLPQPPSVRHSKALWYRCLMTETLRLSVDIKITTPPVLRGYSRVRAGCGPSRRNWWAVTQQEPTLDTLHSRAFPCLFPP